MNNLTYGKAFRRVTRTALCSVISLAVLFTMMPSAPVYAESADYKVKMDAAQQQVDRYSNQLAQDKKALDAAEAELDPAEDALNEAADAYNKAEDNLDQKSADYIYYMIRKAWPNDVARFKSAYSRDYNEYCKKVSNFDTQGHIMYSDDYLIEDLNASSSSLIRSIMSDYKTKHGEGSFKRALVATQGYFNTLEALDNIDRCNEIRADRTELAKFYVDVLNESVPDNIPQLRISPYLMKASAVNVTLNLDGKCDHIYYNYGLNLPRAKAQNCVAGKYSKDGSSVEPFIAWWDRENTAHMSAHNENLCDPGFTLTGFALANRNKVTGGSFSSQDFMLPNASGFTSYSVEEYRSGLISYCTSELAVFNSKSDAYTSVYNTYRKAKASYDSAKYAYDATAKKLSDAQASYERFKKLYEDALTEEQNRTYTIKFYDGYDGSLISQQTVVKGSSVTPPTPPAHAGYEFKGWDNEAYKNVTRNWSVSALYSEITSGGETGGNTGDATYYTVKFVDGLNGLVLSTQRVQYGQNAVPPAAPNYSGYKFVGWDTAFTRINSNRIIRSVYDKVSSSASGNDTSQGSGPDSDEFYDYDNAAAVNSAEAEAAAQYKANGNAYIDSSLPKVKIKAPKKGRKSFTARWKKLSKKQRKAVKGIEIEYSLKRDFSKSIKFKSTGKKKTSLKVRKLVSGKAYYVRAHTYVIKNGKKYVSRWSAVKKVKVQ